jgi:hypothetical protein
MSHILYSLFSHSNSQWSMLQRLLWRLRHVLHHKQSTQSIQCLQVLWRFVFLFSHSFGVWVPSSHSCSFLGYEGYGCTDATNAISTRIYLASVLFLTLSNMIFMFPICLALYRRWYIEALIYFYNMFFSTVIQPFPLLSYIYEQFKIDSFSSYLSFTTRVTKSSTRFAYSTTTDCNWPTS